MSAPALPEVTTVETPEEFDAEVSRRDPRLLVAYLWGPQCPNCEVFARAFPLLREKLSGVPVRFVKKDVYAHPALATRYGVHGIPTFLVFRDGKLQGRMTSYRGEEFFLTVVREQAEGAAP